VVGHGWEIEQSLPTVPLEHFSGRNRGLISRTPVFCLRLGNSLKGPFSKSHLGRDPVTHPASKRRKGFGDALTQLPQALSEANRYSPFSGDWVCS
jgi:hypothetical protein